MGSKLLTMYEYPFSRDWNLSDLYHVNMWLVSFPHPKIIKPCPAPFQVKLQLVGMDTLDWSYGLGLWRKTPTYRADSQGGHLVLFLEAKGEISDYYRQFNKIAVEPVGNPIANHELCSYKYNIS